MNDRTSLMTKQKSKWTKILFNYNKIINNNNANNISINTNNLKAVKFIDKKLVDE